MLPKALPGEQRKKRSHQYCSPKLYLVSKDLAKMQCSPELYLGNKKGDLTNTVSPTPLPGEQRRRSYQCSVPHSSTWETKISSTWETKISSTWGTKKEISPMQCSPQLYLGNKGDLPNAVFPTALPGQQRRSPQCSVPQSSTWQQRRSHHYSVPHSSTWQQRRSHQCSVPQSSTWATKEISSTWATKAISSTWATKEISPMQCSCWGAKKKKTTTVQILTDSKTSCQAGKMSSWQKISFLFSFQGFFFFL